MHHAFTEVQDSKGLYYGWVVVGASFVMFAIAFGIQYSFGIFFRPLQDSFGWSRATTSWAATAHLTVFALGQLPVGWALDRVKAGRLIAVAAVLLGFSLIMCSRISEPWQLYLLYGLPLGIAMSICGPIILSVVTRWFTRHRGIALGLTSAGIGAGTLIGAPVSNWLIISYGWRGAFVAMGVAGFVLILACSFFIKVPPAAKGAIPSPLPSYMASIRQAISSKPLLLIIVANIVANFNLRMVMVHIAPYAIDRGISAYMAALAIGAIGGASTVGRMVMGFVQDKIGPRRAIIICMSTQVFAMSTIPFIGSDIFFLVFALVFGFVYGGDVPQFPSLVAGVFGTVSIGTIYGVVMAMGNFGGALGPIMAGYVFDMTGTYTFVFLSAALLLLVGVTCMWRLGGSGRKA